MSHDKRLLAALLTELERTIGNQADNVRLLKGCKSKSNVSIGAMMVATSAWEIRRIACRIADEADQV